MARIIAPNSQFSGVRAGVAISEGVGQTDNANAIAYFVRQGYTVEADAADLEEQDATWSETADFQAASEVDLRAFAAQQDPVIDLAGADTKADVIAAIELALEEA